MRRVAENGPNLDRRRRNARTVDGTPLARARPAPAPAPAADRLPSATRPTRFPTVWTHVRPLPWTSAARSGSARARPSRPRPRVVSEPRPNPPPRASLPACRSARGQRTTDWMLRSTVSRAKMPPARAQSCGDGPPECPIALSRRRPRSAARPPRSAARPAHHLMTFLLRNDSSHRPPSDGRRLSSIWRLRTRSQRARPQRLRPHRRGRRVASRPPPRRRPLRHPTQAMEMQDRGSRRSRPATSSVAQARPTSRRPPSSPPCPQRPPPPPPPRRRLPRPVESGLWVRSRRDTHPEP